MKKISLVIAMIAWFAVLAQYYLMMENRVVSIGESTIRFFSFFTILTNLLVAIYFTIITFKPGGRASTFIYAPGTLTAITTYITVVALVYQAILRQLWHPEGLQMIVDELLHSIVPAFVIVYWYLYENKSPVTYKDIPKWLIYPLIYLMYILARGRLADFYPYPFINVHNLGISKVCINSILLTVLFAGISAVFITIGKAAGKQH